jgi:hypothetical protein
LAAFADTGARMAMLPRKTASAVVFKQTSPILIFGPKFHSANIDVAFKPI